MAVPAVVAAISAASALYQVGAGISDRAKARKAAKEYRRQDLSNIYKDVGISTAAEELASERISRNVATQTEALSKLGSRGSGQIGRVAQQAQEAEREIGANLDRKKKELEALIASDEARIRQMKEQRDVANIEGIGQLGAVGTQNIASGLGNLASSAGQYARLTGSGGAQMGTNTSQINANQTYDPSTIVDSGAYNIT